MRWSKLSKTTAFRLSMIYLVLFLTCFIALGGGVFILTKKALDEQLKATLVTAVFQLQSIYKDQGISELVKEIREREDITAWDAPDFALIDASKKRLAGSLPSRDYRPGFEIFAGPVEPDNPSESETIYANTMPLPGGYLLTAGEDGDYIEDFGETLVEAFAWSGFAVSCLGFLCGSILNRSFLKKAEALTNSAHRIINGDISHRLSVSASGDELDNLAILINLMLDQINKLVDDLRQISSDIAHDLRTPIGRLRQRLEEAQHQSLSAERYRDNMGLAIVELDTILATFSGLLRIAQIESGTRKQDFKPVELGSLITHVVEALLPSTDENDKRLNLEIEKNYVVTGDKELITQLMFNLVENAIRHTPPGSQINIILRGADGVAELMVADNGAGIPGEFREKVFQRFYRLEKSRSTPGNGLGLSIVKAIADLHGATVSLLDNHPGLIATVRFTMAADELSI